MMATIGDDVRLEAGSWHDLDSVMTVMNSAFGELYGEAWTRSQLAGILPMAGVSLTLARDHGDEAIGFSLCRTVADESELLLIAVLPSYHRRGIGRRLLDEFLTRARNDRVVRQEFHLQIVRELHLVREPLLLDRRLDEPRILNRSSDLGRDRGDQFLVAGGERLSGSTIRQVHDAEGLSAARGRRCPRDRNGEHLAASIARLLIA